MRNECVASLLWSSSSDDGEDENVTVEKVGFSESKKPVIVTSVGKAYIYRQVKVYMFVYWAINHVVVDYTLCC